MKKRTTLYKIENLGASIRACRQKRGLSLQNVAEAGGITRFFLSHIETGKRLPSLETLIRIAEGLGVSVDEMIGRTVRANRHFVSDKVKKSDRILEA